MRSRTLGETTLRLTELSFGATSIGNLYRAVSREDAFTTIGLAWDRGIRYFDVAPLYGLGLAERRLGDFLRAKPRDEFVLSTKVGRLLKAGSESGDRNYGYVDALPFRVNYDYSYDGIMRSYEDSLQRLGLDSINILYVHDLEPASFDNNATYQYHLDTFTSDGVKALAKLKSDGRIQAYGLGVNQVSACIDTLSRVALDCILLAGRYSLLDRSACDSLLSLCEASRTALIVGGVFNSGILATGARPGATFDYKEASPEILERVRKMERVAARWKVSLAGAALNFPLRSELVASVLIGTAKAPSLQKNLQLFSIAVPPEAWTAMDEIAFGS